MVMRVRVAFPRPQLDDDVDVLRGRVEAHGGQLGEGAAMSNPMHMTAWFDDDATARALADDLNAEGHFWAQLLEPRQFGSEPGPTGADDG